MRPPWISPVAFFCRGFVKVLLVAKPWRGGLADYLFLALQELFPQQVDWIATRPRTCSERIAYYRDKKKWQASLLERIRSRSYQAAIFINHLPLFEQLDYKPGHILWMTDGPNPRPGELAPYGRVFLSDPGYAREVQKVVDAARYGGELGFAHCPSTHVWAGPRRPDRGLCFIGNHDSKRDAHLRSLLQTADLRPTIVGNHFLQHPLFWSSPLAFRPSVPNAGMGSIYARHKISINIHARVVRQGTNMRTFECAAYGIPQLVEYREGLERYFEPGREIEVYRTLEELHEKSRRLLGESERSEKMAARAHRRALAEHTYVHRIRTLLEGVVF